MRTPTLRSLWRALTSIIPHPVIDPRRPEQAPRPASRRERRTLSPPGVARAAPPLSPSTPQTTSARDCRNHWNLRPSRPALAVPTRLLLVVADDRRRKPRLDGSPERRSGTFCRHLGWAGQSACGRDRSLEGSVDGRGPQLAASGSIASEDLQPLRVVTPEVITLAYYGQLSHTEIAAHLGLPAGTVKGRMRLELQKLQADIKHAAA
jgi:Sigma-70, region 4